MPVAKVQPPVAQRFEPPLVLPARTCQWIEAGRFCGAPSVPGLVPGAHATGLRPLWQRGRDHPAAHRRPDQRASDIPHGLRHSLPRGSRGENLQVIPADLRIREMPRLVSTAGAHYLRAPGSLGALSRRRLGGGRSEHCNTGLPLDLSRRDAGRPARIPRAGAAGEEQQRRVVCHHAGQRHCPPELW